MDTQFNRRLWISSAIILGSIAIASAAFYYISQDISGNVNKIVADRMLINQQTNAVSTLAELKDDAASAQPYQAAMEQLLPTQDGLIGFSGWLQGIGNADQVAVTTTFNPNAIINNNTPGNPNSAGAMGFSLQAQGSVAAIAAFMEDIQTKSGFFVQINSFNLVGGSSGDMLSAQGLVFFQPGTTNS
jgi:hypothetical protein